MVVSNISSNLDNTKIVLKLSLQKSWSQPHAFLYTVITKWIMQQHSDTGELCYIYVLPLKSIVDLNLGPDKSVFSFYIEINFFQV